MSKKPRKTKSLKGKSKTNNVIKIDDYVEKKIQESGLRLVLAKNDNGFEDDNTDLLIDHEGFYIEFIPDDSWDSDNDGYSR